MQYLNLAIDNDKTNVTAELLNYKNEHFPDFAPWRSLPWRTCSILSPEKQG